MHGTTGKKNNLPTIF